MPDDRVREALEKVQQVLPQRPSSGLKKNASATAAWVDGVRCEVEGSGGERVVTDMPAAMGGNAEGPNPGWLLRASMASCTATTIAIRAALLGIELTSLKVEVFSESDPRGLVGLEGGSTALVRLRMSISIGASNVPKDQLVELAKWAESRSHVSCTLRERPPIALAVSVVDSR